MLCRELNRWSAALWTLAHADSVEPTTIRLKRPCGRWGCDARGVLALTAKRALSLRSFWYGCRGWERLVLSEVDGCWTSWWERARPCLPVIRGLRPLGWISSEVRGHILNHPGAAVLDGTPAAAPYLSASSSGLHQLPVHTSLHVMASRHSVYSTGGIQ
jgi:hypothetical protein